MLLHQGQPVQLFPLLGNLPPGHPEDADAADPHLLPVAQLGAAVEVCWRVRRSASRQAVQAVGDRALAFDLPTGVVVGGSTRLILPWDPSGRPVPMA
jgi:hypothetical protein